MRGEDDYVLRWDLLLLAQVTDQRRDRGRPVVDRHLDDDARAVATVLERGGDVLLLIEHFNRQIAAATGNEPLELSNDALDALQDYRWPGNVRELRNLIGRLHVLARGGIVDLHDLPGEITAGDSHTMAMHGGHPAAMLEASTGSFEEAERQAIKNVLAAERGNLSKVALRLGISRPTLYRKLDQYGIRRGFV